jgi:hypothetical protein
VGLRLALVAVCFSLALASCASRRAPIDAAQSPLPVATGDYPMRGHAPDYSWIAGTVDRDLSCIYLEYGAARRAPDARVVLAVTPEQAPQLRQGDAIVVKGELTALAYGTCGQPSYRIVSIEEH